MTPTAPPRTRRWVGKLSSLLLAVVVASIAVGAIGTFTGVWRLTTIDTGSMGPALNPGDVAVLVSEPTDNLAVGQVVAFHPPGEPGLTVIHRVISVDRSHAAPVFQTKGDANNGADEWHAVVNGDVVWRETARIGAVGWAVVWVQLPAIRFAVLVAIAVLIVGLGLKWTWRPTARTTPQLPAASTSGARPDPPCVPARNAGRTRHASGRHLRRT